jgi:hypothetical protein
MRKTGLVAAFVAAAMFGAFVLAPTGAKESASQRAVATQADSFTNIPVRGRTAEGDRFRGRLDVRRFVDSAGEGIKAVGRLDGVVRDSDGDLIGRVENKRVRIPVTNVAVDPGTAAARVQASCDILHLELGPLDLDLLGLVIHLNRIVLDIDAEPGPGNLLGNLLCAIAGLLDGPPALEGVLADILSALAAILRLLGR